MSLDDIKDFILELKEDSTLPKNVRTTLEMIEGLLEEEKPDIHKALQELEEIVDSTEIESYIRTQLWDLMSALESLS